MHRLFEDYPQAIQRTIDIADACTFDLKELQYEYPDEIVPREKSAIEYLSELTWTGADNAIPMACRKKSAS